MSCGIGMLGLNGVNAKLIADALRAKHNIYTAVMEHEEYTGMRITPGIYTTVGEIDTFSKAMEDFIRVQPPAHVDVGREPGRNSDLTVWCHRQTWARGTEGHQLSLCEKPGTHQCLAGRSGEVRVLARG